MSARKLVLSRFGVDKSKQKISSFNHSSIAVTSGIQVQCGYHYTNVTSLNHILSSGCFFSTDCRYQNDPKEFFWGYTNFVSMLKKDSRINQLPFKQTIDDLPNVINSVLASSSRDLAPFKNNFANLYNISFCSELDDLGQWDRYAGECGVAIEIDFDYLRSHASLALCSVAGQDEKFIVLPIEPFPITYFDPNDAEAENTVKPLVDAFFEQMRVEGDSRLAEFLVKTTINLLAIHIKDKRYQYEREIRISFYPYKASSNDSLNYNCQLVYTEDNHRMIPHVPVYCFPSSAFEDEGGIELSKNNSGWPIKRIVVGPGRNQADVYESLIHRLEAGTMHVLQYDDEEVIKRKLDFFEAAVNYYKQKHTESPILKQALDKIETIRDDFERILQIQYAKYRSLCEIFEMYEQRRYCTSQGIILEKSDLEYNFKK